MAGRPAGRASAQPAPNPRRFEIVEVLSERRMLPAITFVFSRAGCDQAVQQCVSDGLRLTSADERAEIRRIAEEHTDALSDEDLEVLRYGEWITGLEAGLAAHHARHGPPDEGGCRGGVRRRPREDGLRDGDAVARDQHARPVGGDREAVEVHR